MKQNDHSLSRLQSQTSFENYQQKIPVFDKSFAIRQCRCPVLIDILQAAKRITNFRRPFPRFISVLSSHSGQFTATQDGQMDWNESPESVHPPFRGVIHSSTRCPQTPHSS